MKNSQNFEVALQKTKLDELQKIIFQQRFIQVLRAFELRCARLSVFFHILRILVTVGSLIVPALLSIQYSDTSGNTSIKDPESFAYEIYWATWVISLLVTTSNGVSTVFKIEKKYYFLHTTMEQLRSEGWQYLELSGRYSGFYTPNITPTHMNQFIYFCHAVEKIKMHQVEEEYFKLTEASTIQQTNQSTDSKTEKKENPLIHPTPQIGLDQIAKNLPQDLRKQLLSMSSIDGGTYPSETESDSEKKENNGAKAITMPMQSELSKTTHGEKSILQNASDAKV